MMGPGFAAEVGKQLVVTILILMAATAVITALVIISIPELWNIVVVWLHKITG